MRCFWANGLPPPLAKNFSYAYATKRCQFRRLLCNSRDSTVVVVKKRHCKSGQYRCGISFRHNCLTAKNDKSETCSLTRVTLFSFPKGVKSTFFFLSRAKFFWVLSALDLKETTATLNLQGSPPVTAIENDRE